MNFIIELCYYSQVDTVCYVFAESFSAPLTGLNWYRITDVVSDVVYTVDSSNKYERFRLKGQKINSITYFSTGPLSNGNIGRVDATFGNYYRMYPLPTVDQMFKNAERLRRPFDRSFFETNTYKMPASPLDEALNIKDFFI